MSDDAQESTASDGGASYLSWNLNVDDLKHEERTLLHVLGAAVLTQWFELPRDVQKALFDRAAGARRLEIDDLRGNLARFLHEHGQ